MGGPERGGDGDGIDEVSDQEDDDPAEANGVFKES